MKNLGIIGANGFVGSNLSKSFLESIPVTRSNISEIEKLNCSHFVVSAVSATKWMANLDPLKDRREIQSLLSKLRPNRGYCITLISTIDVFPRNVEFHEGTEIGLMEKDEAYGKNRAWLENELKEKFKDDLTIIRLPGLFGPGLKKNLLFDLLNNRELARFNPESKFQFYNVGNLADDLSTVWREKIRLQNLATEPISVYQILALFNRLESSFPQERIFEYRMKTVNSLLFKSPRNEYISDSQSTLDQIKNWVSREK